MQLKLKCVFELQIVEKQWAAIFIQCTLIR